MIRDLRDVTGAQTSLSQEHSRIASRIQKVLEDANIKLASVASNVLGKSGSDVGDHHRRRRKSKADGRSCSWSLTAKASAASDRSGMPVRDPHRFLLLGTGSKGETATVIGSQLPPLQLRCATELRFRWFRKARPGNEP